MANYPRRSNNQFFFIQWFLDLPIRKKQLMGLLVSEAISIGGLVGVSSFLMIRGIRAQGRQQAKAELAVTQVNYNIKIDQMGFGFRGQSDNLAIIEAAKSYANFGTLDVELETRVKQILENEIRSRKIEYATLVGNDLTVIVNANQNRRGEIFNPHNLVGKVLENPQQIKTSEIVTRQELMRESPPNFNPENPENSLIRYTVTPVFSPDTQTVIAVLVSGDLIDGKTATWNQTLDALEGGYIAIYLRPPQGKLELAISILEGESQNNQPSGSLEQQSKNLIFNQPLPDLQPIFSALSTPDKVITHRLKIEGKPYTVAAKSIKNFAGNPVAVLVRGTPETPLNKLLKQSLSLQFSLSLLALAFDVIIALILAGVIARPLQKLKTATQEFSAGNLRARSQVFSSDEIGELTETFNRMADQILQAFKTEEAILREQSELNTQLEQKVKERTLQLENAQSQLVLREKMSILGQLVAGIAHEINNPVSFIAGNLSHAQNYAQDLIRLVQLYDQYYPEPAPEIVEEIEEIDLEYLIKDFSQLLTSMQEGTKRIAEISSSMRTFSRSDAQTKVEFNLHDGIESTLMILKHRLKANSVRPEINVIKKYGNLPEIECYPGQLNQVFMNLLSNAIDAVEESNTGRSFEEISARPNCITIETEFLPETEGVIVRIRDNGIGMTPEIKAKIFDYLFTTKKVGKGTGLGLSIVRQIVEDKHGGNIDLTSESGKGSEFSISLPARV